MYKKDQFKKLASGVTLMASAPTLASFALPGGSGSADLYKDLNIPSEYSGINWSKVLKVLGYSVLAAVGISAVIYLAATLLWKKEDNVSLKKLEDNDKADNIKENKEEQGGKNENGDIDVKGVEEKNIDRKQDEDGDVPEEKEGKLTLKGLVNKVCEKYKQLTQDMKSIEGQIKEKEKEKEELRNQHSQFREKCEQKMRENEDNIRGKRDIISFIYSTEIKRFLDAAKEMLDVVDKCEKCCKFKEKIKSLNAKKEKIGRSDDLEDEYEIEDEDEDEYEIEYEIKDEDEDESSLKKLRKDKKRKKKEEERKKKEEERKKKEEEEEERKKKVLDLEKQIEKLNGELKSFEQSNFAGTSYKEELNKVMTFKNNGFLVDKRLQQFKEMKSGGAREVFEASNTILSIKNVSDSTTVLGKVKEACSKFMAGFENADKGAWKKEIEESIGKLQKASQDEGARLQEQLDKIRHSFESKDVDISKLEQDLKVKKESRREIKNAFYGWIWFVRYVETTYGKDSEEGKLVSRSETEQFDKVKIDLNVNFDN